MYITTKGRYGVQALTDLAMYSQDKPVSITKIAHRQKLSANYLEQLFAMLKKSDLIKSIRGAGGGYVLSRSADEISMLEVLRVLEGEIELAEALHQPEVSDVAFNTMISCNQALWHPMEKSIKQLLEQVTLQDLCDELNQQNAISSDYYYI